MFKSYLILFDKVAEQGYRNRELDFPVFNDAREALKELAARGSKIAIFSSGGSRTTQWQMRTAGLAGIIKGYYSQSQPEIGSKYEARSYLAIARDLGVSVSDMVYVTDDIKEAKGAVSAGVRKVYFINRAAKNEELGKQKDGYITIDDYDEVVKDLEKEQGQAESSLEQEISEESAGEDSVQEAA